jgi:CheY-like chemotaxis protein
MAGGAKKVFVIDDDTALRTAYAAAISKLGYDVKTAADGAEAVGMVKSDAPDLILLDLLMPNLDGVGFLKQLRSDPQNDQVKVVIASNFESTPEAENLGVSKFISKLQVQPEGVADQIDQLLK